MNKNVRIQLKNYLKAQKKRFQEHPMTQDVKK